MDYKMKCEPENGTMFGATSKLMDNEATTLAERRAKISKITLEIETILLREDVTMGELGDIMDMFNARAHSVFSETKIKDVKETYERRN